MIIGFEEYTHELTDLELKYVVPTIIPILEDAEGPKNAVSAAMLIKHIEHLTGYSTHDSRIRQAIHHLRITETIRNLCANGKGYFIAQKKEKVETYLLSLSQRVNSIEEMKRAVRYSSTFV